MTRPGLSSEKVLSHREVKKDVFTEEWVGVGLKEGKTSVEVRSSVEPAGKIRILLLLLLIRE